MAATRSKTPARRAPSRTTKRKPAPRKPARVKKRRKSTAGLAGHHRPELAGLGVAGLGVLRAAVLWLGLNGGPVRGVAPGAVGAAAYLAPLVLVPLGALIVARSALV